MLKRINYLMVFFLVIFSLLLAKIFYYQIIKGQDLTAQVVKMRSQSIAVRELSRGEILDRHQSSLTQNAGFYRLYCRPQAILPLQGSKQIAMLELAERVASQLEGGDKQEIFSLISQPLASGKLLIKLRSDLSSDEIMRLQAVPHPALEIVPQLKRYRQDGFLAHVIGYVSADGIDGQAGLEKSYNQFLQKGGARLEVLAMHDARGQAISGINLKIKADAQEKNALGLTIDARVQEVVENVMNASIARGAVVVMDVHSKEILALASRPTYNQYRVKEYLSDLQSPLLNRALSSYYPGSLFKIVVTMAIVEEDLVVPGEEFTCSGRYVFNEDLAINCWKKEGHGVLSFEQALAGSCNPTFISLGLRLGKNQLLQYVDKLHLTSTELIGMPGQQRDSCVRIDGGEAALANACLGQQGVMLTPVQIASLLATVADNGRWAAPRIVKYTLDESGRREDLKAPRAEQVISTRTARKVQSMLEGVVTAGTGQSARISEVLIAGKTATSQTGRLKENDEEVLNTWFAGYLPADEPRWAIVVLAEEGKSGSENCAPVFKEIARQILTINP